MTTYHVYSLPDANPYMGGGEYLGKFHAQSLDDAFRIAVAFEVDEGRSIAVSDGELIL